MAKGNYYGILSSSTNGVMNKPLMAEMKAAGITYKERTGFTDRTSAQALLDSARFDLFRDRLEVSEYTFI